MKCLILLFLLCGAACSTAPTAHKTASKSEHNPDFAYVRLETAQGNIDLELDGVHAPVTTKNFLRYVNGKYYDGGEFHRTVTLDNQANNEIKIEVIQGGPAEGKKEFAAIPIETTAMTGLHHVDGTLSMARDGPNTATSNFFICVNDQPELDFGGKRNPDGQGFAAFGRVIGGYEIVRTIQHSSAKGQALTPPIKIFRAIILPVDED